MTSETINKLNNLNIQLYRDVAGEFSNKRSHPWEGWEIMVKRFADLGFAPENVLDVACGNGRFYEFLSQHYKIDYRGMDTSEELLSIASLRHTDLKVFKHDVLQYPWPVGHFDLIVAFGILHHLPGAATRQVFFAELSRHIDLEGYAVFTTWNFRDQPWLTKRKHAWAEIGLSPDDVDAGDYLLDWNNDPKLLRYAHAYTPNEVTQLCVNVGLEIKDHFTADGRNKTGNRYYIVQKRENVYE